MCSASAAEGTEALTWLHLLCTSTSGLVQLPRFSVGKLENGIVPYILEMLLAVLFWLVADLWFGKAVTVRGLPLPNCTVSFAKQLHLSGA